MVIKVKSWFYQQEQSKAGKYNFTLKWDTLIVNTGKVNPETCTKWKEIGNCFYGKVIKETEKAIQVELFYWNLNKGRHYRYLTDLPLEKEKRWKTWIPKSVLLNEGMPKYFPY